jgi:hypothetical protein
MPRMPRLKMPKQRSMGVGVGITADVFASVGKDCVVPREGGAYVDVEGVLVVSDTGDRGARRATMSTTQKRSETRTQPLPTCRSWFDRRGYICVPKRVNVRVRPIVKVRGSKHNLQMLDVEEPSERLVAQRVRNRIMEEILGLSQGEAGVREVGPTEWFESFFDWFPYEGEPEWYPAMTPEEADAVRAVCTIMQQAIAAKDISKQPTVDEIIQTGWRERVAPTAKRALDVLMARGRFSEEQEEDEPSNPIPWP